MVGRLIADVSSDGVHQPSIKRVRVQGLRGGEHAAEATRLCDWGRTSAPPTVRTAAERAGAVRDVAGAPPPRRAAGATAGAKAVALIFAKTFWGWSFPEVRGARCYEGTTVDCVGGRQCVLLRFVCQHLRGSVATRGGFWVA